jgi:hypothetical protein
MLQALSATSDDRRRELSLFATSFVYYIMCVQQVWHDTLSQHILFNKGRQITIVKVSHVWLRASLLDAIIIHLIDSTTRFVIWFGFEAKRNIPKVVQAKRTDHRCAFRITEQ